QSISYIKLDGNNGIGYNGIFIRQRSNVVIHHCTIVNFNHNGVLFLGGTDFFEQPSVYPSGNQLYNSFIKDCENLILLMGQQGALIHDNILDNRTDVSRITRIVDAGTSFNKGTKFYNNKCYKPDNAGPYWNFMIEHWNCEGGFEIYGNEFYGSDCVLDVGGYYNVKGAYEYSWSIHDNLFTTLSGTNVPLTDHGATSITLEGANVEYVQIYNNRFEKLLKPIGSSEGGGGAATLNHIYIHNNLLVNCGTGISGCHAYPVLAMNQYMAGSTMSDIYISNNVITSDGITHLGGIGVETAQGSNINLKNNILVGFQNWGAIWLTNNGTLNNIHVDYNDFYNNIAAIDIGGNAMTNYTTINNKTSNPSFVSATDFHLSTGSSCIDAGIDVGLTLDYEGNPIPYNFLPDIGAYEYTSGSSNQAPQIQNQNFQLNENSSNGTNVGTVIATDPDAGQTLTFSLLSGNTNGAFTINASSGVLSVASAAALNFEVTPTFALVVKVQDNGTGNLSSQATTTVSLLNVNEVPVITNQAFSVTENSA
ncbi:MAG: cadherin domain-containing protein, partial [Bacteroidales bacterium]